MKELNQMPRKEMATLIVDDQIKRGIIKKENREIQINARLKGILKMSWTDLFKTYKAMF